MGKGWGESEDWVKVRVGVRSGVRFDRGRLGLGLEYKGEEGGCAVYHLVGDGEGRGVLPRWSVLLEGKGYFVLVCVVGNDVR